LASRDVRFVPCSDHFADAWAAFREQRRAVLSFADAAIVAVARAFGSPFVATFDRGFQGLEGIRVLPGE
jgi:predicted nucleic acid-binding protein